MHSAFLRADGASHMLRTILTLKISKLSDLSDSLQHVCVATWPFMFVLAECTWHFSNPFLGGLRFGCGNHYCLLFAESCQLGLAALHVQSADNHQPDGYVGVCVCVC